MLRAVQAGLPLVLSAFLAAPAAGTAQECTEEDAEATEQSLGAVIDLLKAAPGKRGAWDKLGPALRQYRHCDEEELSELFSEAVCRQLAQGWKDAPSIAQAGRRDPALQAFLLAHLDHSCSPADLDAIAKNALLRCPRYGKKFCAAVKARVTQVLVDHPALPPQE